jgi:hypothetical protein
VATCLGIPGLRSLYGTDSVARELNMPKSPGKAHHLFRFSSEDKLLTGILGLFKSEFEKPYLRAWKE